MLRYVIPYWNADKRVKELVSFCLAKGVDEVVLFTGIMGFWYGSSVGSHETLGEARESAKILKGAMEELRAAGIESSINVNCTIGHGDLGQDLSGKFPWQFQVDVGGTKSKACVCPLDPDWRRHIAEIYRTYAALNPKIIWVDDDFRYHNHIPVEWGCFCPLHLEEFSERFGKHLVREELVKRILSPGAHLNDERRVWFELLDESMIEVAAILERSVHKVSPNAKLGLMTDPPEIYSPEGRTWLKLLKALCGPHEPILRPSLGPYTESDKRSIAAGISYTLHTMALAGRARIFPELENYPYTRFSKSVKFTWLQMALCQLHGISGITLDLYDFMGAPLSEESNYGDMLLNARGPLGSIAELASGGVPKGVQLFYHEHGALHRRTEGMDWSELVVKRPWDLSLPLLGFSVTYRESPVCAVSGDSVLALEDAALREIMTKALLLDSGAASALCARGLSELIGVDVGSRIFDCFAEDIVDGDFGKRIGDDHTLLSPPMPGTGSVRKLMPLSGARVTSRLLNQEGEVIGSGLTLFENGSGGRIAVLPYDGQSGYLGSIAFRNWRRQAQLKTTIGWLGRGSIPFHIEGAADVLPIRIDKPGRIVLGIANLSSDAISVVRGSVGDLRPCGYKVSSLNRNGRIEDRSQEATLEEVERVHKITVPMEIEPLGFGLIVLDEM